MIDGVRLAERRVLTSDQGAVLHFLREDAPEFTHCGEIYFSEVLPGVEKSWKYHRESRQAFVVPVGRLRFTLWDDRADSPTQGRTETIELGRPEAYRLLVVPPRVWYRFVALGPTPGLIANCRDRVHQDGETEQRPAHDPRMPRS